MISAQLKSKTSWCQQDLIHMCRVAMFSAEIGRGKKKYNIFLKKNQVIYMDSPLILSPPFPPLASPLDSKFK